MRPSPETPVYLGALGPRMLEMSGELADGASLNWCTPEQIAWSREHIAEGAAKAGRDPSEINVAEYIRICVDDDVDAARIALAKATMGYALGATVPTDRERQLGYRAHFERMGFTDELAALDDMRRNGASRDEVAEAFPVEILNAVGYFGKADGAAAAFKRLAEGLDTAIVRVVAARRGVDSTLAVMRACAPDAVRAA
jgi:alkanesulfonate monooxygenase SsuD/methylene tetrahydromethanopterin reductase-like flavin-dependent oxidoreductase (luciferase family)